MAEPPAAALRARSFIFAGLYLFFLSWIILFKLNLPHLGSGELRSIKLVPFIADGRYAASGMKESIVNVLLFIPAGLNLRLLLPRLRWIQAAAVGLGISALLEIAQYVLAVGSSDTTDLLTNAGGCLIGFAAAKHLPTLRGICAWLGISLAILSLLFIASPIRFAAPG
ncbi:protein vanZ [Glutamicibacter uratoxydans]|uniref:Protein vanZ n=1 Tax=Glutamicibacter uratoxydans TaxID=43667 RepID=A0A4Y4DJX9_GLUUR|nr:VanZ family protein [Glutamicibacter uratoxydans]GED05286.1 protein vanZ [Glutamicibacter uratoxydans]